jgi:hypothetical protein
MNSLDRKNLKKRYLIWFYKTIRESLDKIERKFTQLEIDRQILKEMRAADAQGNLKKYIDEFVLYIDKKESDGNILKYDDKGELTPDYDHLKTKLEAIEKVIRREFGSSTLQEIRQMYEDEMTQRIVKSVEH